MAKPVILNAGYAGVIPNSNIWVPDRHLNPFNIGFGCIVNGTCTFSVQHTFDDPNVVASPNWFNHSLVNGQTANIDGNYAFPIAAIRVLTTAGTGTVQVTFIQAGVMY